MKATDIKKLYSIMKKSKAKISIEFDGYYIHITTNYWALEIDSMDWIALSQLLEKDGLIINPDESDSWIVEKMKKAYPGAGLWESIVEIVRQENERYSMEVLQDTHLKRYDSNGDVDIFYVNNENASFISEVNSLYVELFTSDSIIPYQGRAIGPIILVDVNDDYKFKGVVMPIRPDKTYKSIRFLANIIGKNDN